jgi:outer membrane protein assembly factor BamE (lipoprotein component of BamABCDE complex)
MRKIGKLTLAVICVSFFSLSCQDFGAPPPRIIPGVSIDGIHLGYTREQVERALGMPTTSGWGDGIDRGWRIYGYYDRTVPNASAFTVWFLETPQTEWGPVDMVSVGAGYSGKTKEGLGIGSHRMEVQRILGLPTKSVLGDTLNAAVDDWYCIQRTSMIFRDYQDTVGFIDLGPSIPYSFSPKCD